MLLRLSAETLHDNDEVARRVFKLLQDPVSSGANRFADVHRGTEIVLSRLEEQYFEFIIHEQGKIIQHYIYLKISLEDKERDLPFRPFNSPLGMGCCFLLKLSTDDDFPMILAKNLWV